MAGFRGRNGTVAGGNRQTHLLEEFPRAQWTWFSADCDGARYVFAYISEFCLSILECKLKDC